MHTSSASIHVTSGHGLGKLTLMVVFMALAAGVLFVGAGGELSSIFSPAPVNLSASK